MFVGSIRDSRDMEQITKNNITHILTIYEDPKQGNVEVKLFNIYLNKIRIGFPYSFIRYGGNYWAIVFIGSKASTNPIF